jgi:cation diffusion facilitator family transporter
MHARSVEPWRHSHVFLGSDHDRNEQRTRLVIGLTLVMMVGEIAAGMVFGSMALLADGWHMATHAGALGIAAFAYAYARRHARNPRYSFGTGKVGDLAAFASAIVLALVAALVAWESAVRLLHPVNIAFEEAIAVATLGLGVNLVSAALLGGHGHGHSQHHDHDHHHGHSHDHGQDTNLRSAYLHVLADALTSVTAILALVAGRWFGWFWMDPLMGIVGSLVIARWSYGLLRDSGRVLLDTQPAPHLAGDIAAAIEADGDTRIADLHLWRVGPGRVAAIIALVTDHPQPPAHYKALLAGHAELAHVTVEVNTCPGHG